MPKEDWIQIKTKDDIKEKQGDDQNNEHMARLEKQKLERKQVKWEQAEILLLRLWENRHSSTF